MIILIGIVAVVVIIYTQRKYEKRRGKHLRNKKLQRDQNADDAK